MQNDKKLIFVNISITCWGLWKFLLNITVTCSTPHGWACRGRWGCPRALRSPWDPSRSFSLRKSFMKHVSNDHFYENRWYLLYSPWLSLSRSLRVSYSPQITLGQWTFETCDRSDKGHYTCVSVMNNEYVENDDAKQIKRNIPLLYIQKNVILVAYNT